MAESRRPSTAAPARTRLNHVFVGFENVPSVDLSALGEKVAAVTLLIGEKQRRLELGLVRQIHEHAAKVTLVEVGASGRNALDLALAWHLGKTAERYPDDPFFIVSKDKDFDPLITHLRARGLAVQRVDAFLALPFLSSRAPARKPVAARRPPATGSGREAGSITPPSRLERHATLPPTPAEVDERFAKLVDRLQHKTKARPVRKKTLLSHINGFYGNQLPDSELETKAATLVQRGIIRIESNGRISYPETNGTSE